MLLSPTPVQQPLSKVESIAMLRTLPGGPASSTAGSWRVRRVVGDEKRAEPVSDGSFSSGRWSRQVLKNVIFMIQSLSRHGIEVV